MFCSFFERTLLLQRNTWQVWILSSIIHAFTVKYPVYAYTVMPWGFLCSTVFNFTTISPPYLPSLISKWDGGGRSGGKSSGQDSCTRGALQVPLPWHWVCSSSCMPQSELGMGFCCLVGPVGLWSCRVGAVHVGWSQSVGPLLSKAGSYQAWAGPTCFGRLGQVD